jgi:alpha-galactosidase
MGWLPRRWTRRMLVIALVPLILPAAAALPAAARPALAFTAPASPVTLPLPPMGWNDWNHFGCGITQQIVEQTADAMVRTGLRGDGYRYVNVDDCWEAPSRDASGALQANPSTFPGGIKALADYVHARGLKFGIYTSAGPTTCQGRPGSAGHYAQDAATFASWGVDYVKFDWCGSPQGDPRQLTAQFRAALNTTGRPIALSISRHGEAWLWQSRPADLWRTSADISDTWNTMLRNAEEEVGLAGIAGPGQWNDPDMLEVGNGGMTGTEYQAHFSLWAELAAPLLSGTDLRNPSPQTLAILGNREVIAVDQDPLARQGDRVRSDGDHEVWTRPLAGGDRAVVLFDRGIYGAEISTTAREVGLGEAPGYTVRDLWAHHSYVSGGGISAYVPPHGAAMFRVHPDKATTPRTAGLASLSAAPGFLPADATTNLTVTLRNNGQAPLNDVKLGLAAPSGWQIRQLSAAPPTAPPGGTTSASFAVSVPASAPQGSAQLAASAQYRPVGGPATATSSEVTVVVPPPAPSPGTSALSDHPRLESDNGWYLPLKVDHSFGPDFCGDCTGGTITLNGTSYPTGLGTYASSQVSYYLGGACSSFNVATGVDDEVRPDVATMPYDHVGTATFLIYADGRLVYNSGVRSYNTPPGQARLDLRGVRELKLVNTDAGDGNFFDHADWAGMKITCG